MELAMNIVNARKSITNRSPAADVSRLLEATRRENAELKRKIAILTRTAESAAKSKTDSEDLLVLAENELKAANDKIARLESKVKELNTALAEATSKKNKKEKQRMQESAQEDVTTSSPSGSADAQ